MGSCRMSCCSEGSALGDAPQLGGRVGRKVLALPSKLMSSSLRAGREPGRMSGSWEPPPKPRLCSFSLRGEHRAYPLTGVEGRAGQARAGRAG